MNILWDGLIQQHLTRGGVSRYCAELMRRQALQKDVQVLTLCPKGAPAFDASAPRLRQISQSGLDRLDQLRLRRFAPDIFQSGYYGTSPMPGLPTVQLAYDFLDARYPCFMANAPGFARHQRQRLESADAVIAISDTTRQDVLAFTHTPSDRVHVVHPSVHAHFLQPLPEPSEANRLRREVTGGAPYWLWVGPGGGYKNRSTFLSAFARTADRSDMHVVIVGNRSNRLTEQEIACLLPHRLLNRIHMETEVDDERLRRLYHASEALVQSSLWEGFGIPLVEAVSCGAKLVVSDIPVFREVGVEGTTYAAPESVDAWEEALNNCRETTVSPAGLLERKHEIESRFSLAQRVEPMMEVYRGLLS